MLTTYMNVKFNKMHRMHSIYIQYTLSKKQIIKRGAALVNTISSYTVLFFAITNYKLPLIPLAYSVG